MGLEGGRLTEERSSSSRLVREPREMEGEAVPASFWGVVMPGGGDEGTEGAGLGPIVLPVSGRICTVAMMGFIS